ncbi:type IV pilin protein [Miltoncostaea marina]|uniref:type IV pilin protein n=1 Tax=Miltoncostaea marina TaxID=2843215 RepID=UPI001C3D0150|nr:prepilin-type N-terminal cleavage/methylation domain-containing protein [Miltoncostaea marina]
MLERLRRRRGEGGFTLIELLVVVIIIGLLAAIAIPAFLGQRDKANDAAAKSLVRNGATAMEAYFADGNTYANADATKLAAIEPNIKWDAANMDAGANQVKFAVTGSGTGYTLESKSKSNITYKYEKKSDSTVERTCGTGCTW